MNVLEQNCDHFIKYLSCPMSEMKDSFSCFYSLCLENYFCNISSWSFIAPFPDLIFSTIQALAKLIEVNQYELSSMQKTEKYFYYHFISFSMLKNLL